ncbi:MAG TPA: hypothetical protein VFA65_08980 [Bryobacteraceae bacterium]|nr:hypothetical protein [Bryobacteraceae bacterium]
MKQFPMYHRGALFSAALALFALPASHALADTNLTGIWAANNGAAYYVRQIGNTIWWAGFDPDAFSPVASKSNSFHRGLTSTQVFQGTLSGDVVTGNWAELPRQSAFNLNQGTLAFRLARDSRGDIVSLQIQSQTGGLTVTSWTRAVIPTLPCTDNIGKRDAYCLFGKVLKNQTGFWGSHESLLDNLKPYKDNSVIFGTVATPYELQSLPATCSDFFAKNDDDADINFDVIVDRANLNAQPGFWNDGWLNSAAHVRGKLDAWQNAIHCETIAFGRQDSQCQATGPVFLPGWGESGANGSLSQGAPIAGGITSISGAVVINGVQMKAGSRVRVTGPLVLDCGHGITSPCHETENDPNDLGTKNLEIHPIYSVDILQDFTAARPANVDLTGTWAASDIGTYYVRQSGNTIWWLGLSRDQGLTFANVFHGTIQNGVVTTKPVQTGAGTVTETSSRPSASPTAPPLFPVITGQWASVPLGSTQGDGGLTLAGTFCKNLNDLTVPCDPTRPPALWNLLVTQSSSNPAFANPPNNRFQWQKLYDRNGAPTPQILAPKIFPLGPVANGLEATGSVPINNIGTAPLVVQSITSTVAALKFSPNNLTIAPGATAHVSVSWLVSTATKPGNQIFDGALTLKSNDPSSPITAVTVRLTVRGGPAR